MQREKLPWLCPAPADFRDKARAGTAEELARLAGYALDINQLHTLAKRAGKLESKGNLKPLKVAMLSNATTKLLMPCLIATGLRYGFLIEEVHAEYEQVIQQAIDPSADLHEADVILVALDYRGIPQLSADFADDESAAVRDALAYVGDIREALKRNGKAILVFQTVPHTPHALFGNADAQIAGSRLRRIDAFNAGLAKACSEWKDLLLDAATLAANVGLDTWHDAVQWHNAKMPFSQACAPLYADHALRLIAASKGKVKKCLVLDLDNTLWGGVIGDDGLEGIVLGQGSAGGEAFLAIQQMALALRARGIILAVCSKNTEEIARGPFKSHREMLLREDHIAVFIANWTDKATNIEAIASALNIGLDSLVFLDDNPVERQQVREALPMVAVPEVPNDAALYPLYISAAGYFESISFSAEDKSRAEQYQANAMRALEASSFRNLDEFHASLNMEIEFAPFDAVGRGRIAQLIGRSNQFNLTTKRYVEADVEAFEKNPEAVTMQIRLKDKYGDNGMISVIVALKKKDHLLIDTWLMSCRVLNRRVEEAVLDELVARAREHGAKKLVGHYIPTDRNGLVKEHYKKLGFTLAQEKNAAQEWHLDITGYQFRKPPMKVIRLSGAERAVA